MKNHNDFLDNQYSEEYFRIIEENINPQGYCETHHIIPVSMGGSDEKDNLVRLTGSDHFKLHILLPYFLKDGSKEKMIYAWHRMSNSRREDATDYEEYSEMRILHAELVSKNNKENWKNNRDEIVEAMMGIPKTQGHKNKIGNFQRSKVTFKNKHTGETGLIDKELFDKNPDLIGCTSGYESPLKGRVTITDGKKNKLIVEQDVIWYLSDGWRLGGKPRHHPKTKCIVCSKDVPNCSYKLHLIACNRRKETNETKT